MAHKTKSEIVALLSEALELEPGVLKPDTIIADVVEWGSLGWLTIMSLIDEKLGIQLDSQEIASFATVEDVVNAILAKIS